MELPIQNAIYLFITTEIVELFLYIRKTGGLVLLVVKMLTSEPCHHVVSFDKWRFLKTPAFRLRVDSDDFMHQKQGSLSPLQSSSKKTLRKNASKSVRKYKQNVLMPPGHPIILLKSNSFNMAAVSVKRSIR